MTLARVLIGAGPLLIGVAVIFPGYAQEPAKADILLRLTEPARSGPVDAVKRDELREVPAPRLDGLSDRVRVNVSVGDSQCLPGDVGGIDPGRANRRAPRAR